jgi:molybdopterin/thiamine biosynthesis adenylyltransferase
MTDRYQRHRLIDWFDQDLIKSHRIGVIGAGAVGNEVIKSLTLLGVGHITVFDYDRIEESNLTRSVLFRGSDVGQFKSEVAATRARELDTTVSIEAIVGDFWKNSTLSDIRSYDVLFCCVDNFEARIRANTVARLSGTDLVNIGIDARHAMVEVFPFGSNSKIACYECTLPHSVYQKLSERYSCGHLRKVSFVEKKIPTTIITSSIAASMAVSMGLRLGYSTETTSAQRFYVDTITGHASVAKMERNDYCPSCGRYEGTETGFVCRRTIGSMADLNPDITVFTSEPILVQYTYNNETTMVFKNASDFDTGFLTSISEDTDQIDVVIKDQFTIGELMELHADRDLPCKFVVFSDGEKQLIAEFME